MPIDPSVAVGAELPDRLFSWDPSDVLLYHLGIGAGSSPGDNLSPDALRYTLDGAGLQVLPSFGSWPRPSTRPTRLHSTCPAASSTWRRSCTGRSRSR